MTIAGRARRRVALLLAIALLLAVGYAGAPPDAAANDTPGGIIDGR